MTNSAAVATPETGGLTLDRSRTALIVVDPQNDFLTEEGAAWSLVGENVLKYGVRDNLGKLLKSAKDGDIETFVSPHYYYPHDKGWHERGAVQSLLSEVNIFPVASPLNTASASETGADIYEPFKEYILDGKTVITSPHKIYGPESNDLVLQLRKRGIENVILAGFAANLCVDSHMRELKEQGFGVIMVKDAVGAPGEEAYQAAMVNYGMIANSVWDTATAATYLQGH